MAMAEPGTDPVGEPEHEGYTADSTLKPGNATDINMTTAASTQTEEELWGVWWPLHRYGFATLFTILCVYALYATVLRICRNRAVGGGVRSRKAVQPVFTFINLLVFFLGLSNAICLFFDPYRRYGGLPFLMSVILSNMPYPCMTSAFALVNWVLISISKMRITQASKLRSVGFLTLVIMSHFLLVISACLVMVYLFPVFVLGLACHSFFVIWGWLLCLTYIYGAWKIIVVDKTNRKTLHGISVRDGSVVAGNESIKSKIGSKVSCRISKGLASMFSRRKMQQEPSDKKAIFTVGQRGNAYQMPLSSCLEYENKITVIDDVTDDDTKTQTEKETGESQQNGWNEKEQSKQGHNQTKNGGADSMKAAELDFSKRQNGVGNGVASPGFDQQNGGKTNGMNRKQMDKQRDKMGSKSAGKMSGTERPRNSTRKVFRISAVTAVLGVAASGLGLFGIVTGMLAGPEDKLSGWPWLIYQSLARLVEIGMGCTMAYFTTQPFPRRRQR